MFVPHQFLADKVALRTMEANMKGHNLTAAEVLQRYKEEELPEFCEVALKDVNQIGNFGERPLHIAASRGNLEEIAALLDGGAEIDAQGELGNTPLHEAVAQGHVEAVQLLLRHGARRDRRNEFGNRPIDEARTASRNDIAKLLE